MKKYLKPASEAINFITEGTLAVSGGTPKVHDQVGGADQFSKKKSMWDSSKDIMGK